MLRRALIAGCAALLALGPARADLPAPIGPVLLVVVNRTGEEIALDRAALEKLPQESFNTTTIWTDGAQAFRGVRLATLMAALGLKGRQITLVAANGYRVQRDAAGLQVDAALLATSRNGKPMSLREKGPLWLVYDYDSDPMFRTEVSYANSIWQLDRILFAD
ncbi:oxidoreductase [Pseudooceanicola sp.]|uniref:oxidoreductase n=1 Tax=Pseudooceanicola sp. TaxID=1914328 RepID=UPI0026076313|nr:oxidoreductase [Pseudooceanicola sp.]MDF1854073.1 oxidoreductase [Pseudooceanicola sp.]